ncbi:MAG: hypothetical protein NVS9B4_08630 [Candidatus Acidiferrum sp.]
MKVPANRNLRARKVLFASVLGLICVLIVFAVNQKTAWNVPVEAKTLKNPIQSSDAALSSARIVYLENCAKCHGKTGAGDGPDAHLYDPEPQKLADPPRLAAMSDGELFYKISEGKRPMPAFKKRLTVDQRWRLVLLLRSMSRSPLP